ncbi:NADP-dependent oxidoreductase [Terriglobus aquaticus]|uniref:NADP-dependent oxidoreductase n=1 Tax=Terriglobus aquaticus TaxID=940139 RepID=A0ABW9KFK0_9BACT|nr:NADP-dependent oxidoreductase [Terriglobus aquaticus]
MKAVVLEEFGGPEKLLYKTDVPDPEISDDEVLIATAASSVNPVDYKVRGSGEIAGMMGVSLPAILGRDVSGLVHRIGSRVAGVAVGDRVIALTNSTYASLVKVPATDITHIPEGVDTVDAAALPLVTLTGDQLIREACALQPGQTVLVTGALGSVGRSAVHSAKTLGAKVIAGVRKKQIDKAQTLGVDGVVALDDDEAMQNLGQFDAVADTVGGETATKLLNHVREGGVFGSLLGPVAGSELHPGVRVSPMRAHPDPQRLKAFAEDLRDGKFTLPIATRFPLEQAGEAQAYAQKGADGKVLLLAL